MRLQDLQPRVVLLADINGREPRLPRSPYGKSKLVACKSCGQEFKIKPSKLALGIGKFCSRKCVYQSQRKAA